MEEECGRGQARERRQQSQGEKGESGNGTVDREADE